MMLTAATAAGAGSTLTVTPGQEYLFSASMTGSGTYSASVDIEWSSDGSKWTRDRTINLSDSVTTAKGKVICPAGFLRANVTDIRGTDAAVTVSGNNAAIASAAAAWRNQFTVTPTGNDDSALLQEAFNDLPARGGSVLIGPGDMTLGAGITIQNADATTKKISLYGSGNLLTDVQWAGSTSGKVFQIRNNVRFAVREMHVRNMVSKGTTKAFFITSYASGSATGPGVFENVEATGFSEAFSIGESAGPSASELKFLGCFANSCDIGFAMRGANSLTNMLIGCGWASCGVGLKAIDPDCIHVYGGTGSYSTEADFSFGPAGAYAVFGFRSESANRLLKAGATSATTVVSMSGVRATQSTNVDTVLIEGMSGRLSLSLTQCQIMGRIRPSSDSSFVAGGNLFMDGVQIFDDYSFIWSSFEGGEYWLRGCWKVNSSGNPVSKFTNEYGHVVSGNKTAYQTF